MAGDLLDGQLPVLGGVANVVAGRVQQSREPLTQGRHGLGRLIHRKRRLRQPDDLGRVADIDRAGLLGTVHQPDTGRRFPGGADDLLMAFMADEQDVVVLGREPPSLIVHLGHERARGVDHAEVALLCLGPDVGSDPVGREHHHRAGRYVGVFIYKYRAALFQRSHHVQVVHDLLADVDGCAVALDRHLDRLHGPVDTGAVAAWLGEEDTPGGRRHVTHVRRGPPGGGRSRARAAHTATPAGDQPLGGGAFLVLRRPG